MGRRHFIQLSLFEELPYKVFLKKLCNVFLRNQFMFKPRIDYLAKCNGKTFALKALELNDIHFTDDIDELPDKLLNDTYYITFLIEHQSLTDFSDPVLESEPFRFVARANINENCCIKLFDFLHGNPWTKSELLKLCEHDIECCRIEYNLAKDLIREFPKSSVSAIDDFLVEYVYNIGDKSSMGGYDELIYIDYFENELKTLPPESA